MNRTRLSLFYLATYLSVTGVSLMAAPDFSLRLLGATGSYGDVFVRFVGGLMFGLAMVVTQIIRHRVAILYPTTVMVRSFFIALILWLYFLTRDPLFLAILAVVALGVTLTLGALCLDRKAGQIAR